MRWSEQRLKQLKREAKAHKKKTGCTHMQALDALAKRNGYPNYHLLHMEYTKQNEES